MPAPRRDAATRIEMAARSGSRVMATVPNDRRDQGGHLAVRARSKAAARAGSIASPRVAVIRNGASAKVGMATSLLAAAILIGAKAQAEAVTVANLPVAVTRTAVNVRAVLGIVRRPVLDTAGSLTVPKAILPAATRGMVVRGPVVFADARAASLVTDVLKTIAASVGLSTGRGSSVRAVAATIRAAASCSRARACFRPQPRQA
jgi:hypothetical protein